MQVRVATPADAPAIAEIYNQGIADWVATFETSPRTPEMVRIWFDDQHPIVLAEEAAVPIAWLSRRLCAKCGRYAGIAEFAVYVARSARGRGAGRAVMEALLTAAEAAGYWKLVSRVFVENTASRALLRSCGFREVGIYEKHGQLDGQWRDVVIVERLIPANLP